MHWESALAKIASQEEEAGQTVALGAWETCHIATERRFIFDHFGLLIDAPMKKDFFVKDLLLNVKNSRQISQSLYKEQCKKSRSLNRLKSRGESSKSNIITNQKFFQMHTMYTMYKKRISSQVQVQQ